jgi:hypothetical protein
MYGTADERDGREPDRRTPASTLESLSHYVTEPAARRLESPVRADEAEDLSPADRE